MRLKQQPPPNHKCAFVCEHSKRHQSKRRFNVLLVSLVHCILLFFVLVLNFICADILFIFIRFCVHIHLANEIKFICQRKKSFSVSNNSYGVFIVFPFVSRVSVVWLLGIVSDDGRNKLKIKLFDR